MKAYEEQKYTVWQENANATLMSYLKRNLLVRPSNASSSGVRVLPNTSNMSTETGVSASASMQKSQGLFFEDFFDIFLNEYLASQFIMLD